MEENSIFTITPPDMQLLEHGPSVTVLSTDSEFIEKIENCHERLYTALPVNIYHPNGPVTENNLAWVMSVIRLSDYVFIDLSTTQELGIITALLLDHRNVFIDEKRSRKDIAKLFNIVEDYIIYESVEEFQEMTLAKVNL